METVTLDVLIKTYMEIGILALMAILLLLGTIVLFKKLLGNESNNAKRLEEQEKRIEDFFADVLEAQRKQNDTLLSQLMDKVVYHTPGVNETKQLNEILQGTNKILKDILLETNASRVCLVQYHNGGRGVNKQSFLKMSVTNEEMQVGETAIMPRFKDQFRSALSYLVNTIDKEDKCYIENAEDMKEIDYGTYDFLKMRDVNQVFLKALHGEDNMIIGFLMISFNNHNKNKADIKKIDSVLDVKSAAIETLLAIKVDNL